MNEKIRRFMEQANWKFADKVTGEFTDYDKRIQKFAQLIVRECGEVADDHNSEVEGVTLGVGKAIKQHFGVEE